MKLELTSISQKLQHLLSAYLDEDIERDAYRSEKADLLSRKKSLEEKIGNPAWPDRLARTPAGLDKDASLLSETAASNDLNVIKASSRKSSARTSFLKTVVSICPHPTIRFATRSAVEFF